MAAGRLARCLGQTVSLSAIDVHTAFNWAWKPGGLMLAILLVLITLSLPTLAVWLALRSALGRLLAEEVGALTCGSGAMLTGQGAIAAILLSLHHSGTVIPAIALDLLLRTLAEAVITFTLFALAFTLRPHSRHRLTV